MQFTKVPGCGTATWTRHRGKLFCCQVCHSHSNMLRYYPAVNLFHSGHSENRQIAVDKSIVISSLKYLQNHKSYSRPPRTPPVLGISEQSAVVSNWIQRNMQETAKRLVWGYRELRQSSLSCLIVFLPILLACNRRCGGVNRNLKWLVQGGNYRTMTPPCLDS
jgi:hypothetical protein